LPGVPVAAFTKTSRRAARAVILPLSAIASARDLSVALRFFTVVLTACRAIARGSPRCFTLIFCRSGGFLGTVLVLVICHAFLEAELRKIAFPAVVRPVIALPVSASTFAGPSSPAGIAQTAPTDVLGSLS
jgi:hypothetical protein